MASEIRVNSLSSRTGLSTVTFTDTGPIFSGITTFQDNSGFNVGTGGSIFSPASNTITLGTNNAERLRITSDGDVGIGTDNTTTTGFSRTIRVKGSSTSSGVSGLFAESYAGSAWFGFYSGSSTTDTPALLYPFNGALRIGTTNSVGTGGFAEKLRITSDGKIGVGVASPQQKIDVVGSAHTVAVFRPDASTVSAYGDASVVNNLINLRMPYGSNPGSANNNGARWGIKFQGINDGSSYGTDTSKSASIYAVSEDATAGYNRQVGLAFYTSDFDANQVERLRIGHDGNIGIGTNNPDATLKVNVASGNNGVVVQNTSTANIALFGARNGDATVQIGQWGSAASGSTFGLSNADLSFIYTTSYSTTHPSALALGTVSNKPIVFATNNTERLRIDSDGNVNVKGGNLSVGTDSATVNFTDSSTTATRFIEIGANGGGSNGDALLITHSSGSGVGYFGYEAGGDRLVVACDNGSGANKIDFIVNAGSATGGSTDNLNNVSPALRITAGGDVLIGGQTAYTYDDTGASNTILDITNSTNNKRGILSLSGNCNANGPSIGTIWFNNDQNSGTSPGGTMKLVAAIQAKAVTSDGNAGDDSGAYLQFLTKPESTALAESMVIHSDGEVTKAKQPSFHATNTTIGQINTDFYGTIVFNEVTSSGNHNIGSHYNAANGVFTAPIAGRYLICARTLTNSTANSNLYVSIFVRLNGTNIAYLGHNHSDSWIMESYSGVLSLAANDNVSIYVDQASAHGYQAYASFSGHLLS